MTPVYKLSANSVRNGRTVYGSMLAGNTAFLPTSFESIATVTVGSGGAANIEFTSIPATYSHLQIRGIARSSGGANWFAVQLNGNAPTKTHTLEGNGSAVGADSHSIGQMVTSSQTADVFSASIIDILDYASTNKNKTVRCLTGRDVNGSGGQINLTSEFLDNTAAITSIKLLPDISTNFAQYSHFALYGIKGAA